MLLIDMSNLPRPLKPGRATRAWTHTTFEDRLRGEAHGLSKTFVGEITQARPRPQSGGVRVHHEADLDVRRGADGEPVSPAGLVKVPHDAAHAVVVGRRPIGHVGAD